MESQIEELTKALKQVQLDSREIELELEAEVLARTQLCDQLQARLDRVEKEKKAVLDDRDGMSRCLQELESRVEEFEESERIKDVSIAALQEENQRLLEELALHEADIAKYQALEAALQRETQEKEEAKEEIRNLTRQLETRTNESKLSRSTSERTIRPAVPSIVQHAELRNSEWRFKNDTQITNRKSPLPKLAMAGRGHGSMLDTS